jgi:hypothetical protein
MPATQNQYRVQLPIWKAYLYDLINRFRVYRWVNMGLVTFGLTKREGAMINHMLVAYDKGDERFRPRAHKFNAIVQSVYTNLGIATIDEIRIADKLFPITKLKTEDLIMELKKLKTFAKETGLKLSEYKSLGEDDLIKLILINIDPNKEYSKDFAAWYGDLPEELFDEAESEPGADDGKNTGSSDTADNDGDEGTGEDEITEDEIMEILEDDSADLDDFKELVNEVSLFKGVSTKGIKDADTLREKLITIMEGGSDEESTGTSSDDGPTNGDGLTADELNEVKAEIAGMKAKDDLIEALADYEEIFGDEIDPDDHKLTIKLRKAMVTHIDDMISAIEAGGDESGDEGGDESGVDYDAEYERYATMGVIKLRKEVKADLGIETRSRKKADILEDVAAYYAAKAEGAEPGDEPGELEINESLINDAEEAEDTDTLLAIAEELGITFNRLDQRSAKRMAVKLRKNLPSDATDSAKGSKGKAAAAAKSNKKADTKAGSDATKEEQVSLFKDIEAMMADGKDEDEIVKAVKPRLKARGVNLKTAKTKVRAYMQVIEIESTKEKGKGKK